MKIEVKYLFFRDDVFRTIADTQHTQGILAVCQKKRNRIISF